MPPGVQCLRCASSKRPCSLLAVHAVGVVSSVGESASERAPARSLPVDLAERARMMRAHMRASTRYAFVSALMIAGCAPVASSGDAATEASTSDIAAPTDATVADATVTPPTDAPVAPPTDALDARDAQPLDAAGPYTCGTMTCGPGEYCLSQCSGVDVRGPDGEVPDLHECRPIPPACNGSLDCECAHPCGPNAGSFPSCRQDNPRTLACQTCA